MMDDVDVEDGYFFLSSSVDDDDRHTKRSGIWGLRLEALSTYRDEDT
jgi:hypothetical protein